MRHFSAQFVYTCQGPPLCRPVITTNDDGIIVSVTDTGGNLPEIAGLAWYNGIIVPGFVNCHSHLELSHYSGMVEQGTGLTGFISSIRRLRNNTDGKAEEMAMLYDSLMASEGIVACADISNGTGSFAAKSKSSIHYITLIESFGIDPAAANTCFAKALAVAGEACRQSLIHNITPHSAYSVSLPLMKLIKEYNAGSRLTSIHFMESAEEIMLLEHRNGPLLHYYHSLGTGPDSLSLPASHADAIMNHVNRIDRLLLVHNAFANEATIDEVNKRGNTYWCLCPGSNLFITGTIPPVRLLREKGCTIVTGTDSAVSNPGLSILAGLAILHNHFPDISLQEMIIWASLNGARALGIDSWAGSIEPGKKPGLLLIENADLANRKISKKSRIKRLI